MFQFIYSAKFGQLTSIELAHDLGTHFFMLLFWLVCSENATILLLPSQDKVGRNLKLFHRSVSTLKETTVRSMAM